MNTQIITFQADEQCLVKTGGIDKYASDTVSYIEAQFTLGENWSGYDQISAIWQSRYGTKRSVLDTEGVCLVPWEMLTKRSDLLVNLVGSIADGDVLTDRLTTFAIKALEISQDVPIDADTPTPITPSEYEQFVATVAADADRAEAAKLDARESAAAANDSALLASQSAQSASESAESASQSAESASQSAEEAEQASQSVLGLTATASVDSSVGTPSVEVTVETVGDHKVMDFDFHNLKGEQGEQGIQGEKGEQGERGETGASGADGFSPTVEVTPTTDGHEVTITDKDGEHTFEVLNGTVEDIYPFLPTDSAQGEIASFSDGANNVPVEDLTIAIEPIQSGSGDPSPTNVRPISGWTGAVVQRTGKNLFSNVFTDYSQPLDYRICPIKLKTGATYSYSFNLVGTQQSGFTVGIARKGDRYTEFGSFITLGNQSTTTKSGTFTVGTDYTDPKLIVYCQNESAFNAIFENYEIQLEFGTTATAYEPYQGQTYPISWATEAGTVYGGTLDVTSGLLTVDRAMVDLGSLNWIYNGRNNANTGNIFYSTGIGSTTKGGGELACSALAVDPNYNASWESLSANAIRYGAPSSVNLVACSENPDADTFKTAMSGVQLVYELATPQTYQLAPTEVRTLLGDNNIWADTGDTEVTYRADIQKYIDKQISAVLNA